MTFKEKVLKAVKTIPAGKTMSYKEVASLAGNPKAARAVGAILHAVWFSDHGQTIPCHRMIRADGKLGGYADGQVKKNQRLAAERATIA